MSGSQQSTDSTTGRVSEQERLRSALGHYSASDIATMVDLLSPGAGVTRRKVERVELLLRLLTDPAAARLALGALSPLARRLLTVAQHGGRTSIAALLLAGQDATHDEALVRQELQQLVASGVLILEGQGVSGTKVPLDLTQPTAFLLQVWVPRALADALATVAEAGDALSLLQDPPAVVTHGTFVQLRRDLYLALRFLRQTGLRLTRLGEPHRADLRKLQTALQAGPLPVRRGEQDAASGGRLGFLLQLLAAAKLVVETDRRLRAAPTSDEFLNLAEPAAAAILYRSWLDLDWSEFRRLAQLSIEPWTYNGSGDLPDQARLGQARRAIVACLAAAPAGWLAVAGIIEQLRQTLPEFLIDRVPIYPPSYYTYHNYYSSDSYYGNRQALEQVYYRGFVRADLRARERRLRKDQDWLEVEGAFVQQVLAEPLTWLGLVDLGGPVDRNAACLQLQAVRLTELGRQLFQEQQPATVPDPVGTLLVVQPNFEVLILNAMTNLDLVARLDSFAEVVSLDRAAIYRLTRSSVLRGLAAGQDITAIIDTLAAASGQALPQNVQQTLLDWGREYDRVQLHWNATILEAPDVATLDSWLQRPALAAKLHRRLTPTVALVAEDAADLPALFAQHGMPLRSINYALDPPQVLSLPEPGLIQLTPEEDDYYLRYRLEQFADLVPSTAGLVEYRVTPASLRRAREQGHAVDDLLALLSFKARAGVSADDVLTLRGWSGAFPPVRHTAVRVVELPPVVSWGELIRVSELRPLVLRILTTNLALVAEEHWPRLAAALQQRGIMVQDGLQIQPQAEKRSAAQRAAVDLGLATGRELLTERQSTDRRLLHRAGLRQLKGKQLVDFIVEALEADQPLVIEFQKETGRRSIVRTVEPHELEVRGGAYYLHGFCRSRQGQRAFRLSDIRAIGLSPD